MGVVIKLVLSYPRGILMEGKKDSDDVTRCLALIQSAQSDNERLASLLIVRYITDIL